MIKIKSFLPKKGRTLAIKPKTLENVEINAKEISTQITESIQFAEQITEPITPKITSYSAIQDNKLEQSKVIELTPRIFDDLPTLNPSQVPNTGLILFEKLTGGLLSQGYQITMQAFLNSIGFPFVAGSTIITPLYSSDQITLTQDFNVGHLKIDTTFLPVPLLDYFTIHSTSSTNSEQQSLLIDIKANPGQNFNIKIGNTTTVLDVIPEYNGIFYVSMNNLTGETIITKLSNDNTR